MPDLTEQVREAMEAITHWPTCVMNFSAVQGPCICRIEERRATAVARALDRAIHDSFVAGRSQRSYVDALPELRERALAALKGAPDA